MCTKKRLQGAANSSKIVATNENLAALENNGGGEGAAVLNTHRRGIDTYWQLMGSTMQPQEPSGLISVVGDEVAWSWDNASAFNRSHGAELKETATVEESLPDCD